MIKADTFISHFMKVWLPWISLSKVASSTLCQCASREYEQLSGFVAAISLTALLGVCYRCLVVQLPVALCVHGSIIQTLKAKVLRLGTCSMVSMQASNFAMPKFFLMRMWPEIITQLGSASVTPTQYCNVATS